jgi:integrase
MTGSITKQGKNSWRITVELGTNSEGKRLRQYSTTRGRKKDAQDKLNELIGNANKGMIPSSGKTTLADYLKNWLDTDVRANCAPRTVESYESTIERHLIPGLGHYRLRELHPEAIEGYYARARKDLSSRSVHYHHRILKHALKHAVEKGYLGRNPCDLVAHLKYTKKEMRTMEPPEVNMLLIATLTSQFYPVVYCALNTGLRQGELLGLRWRDIDFEAKDEKGHPRPSISVCRALYKRQGVCEFREPKTKHSRRSIPMTQNLAAYLREYREGRESLSLHLGRLLKLDDLVFSNVEGEPLDPSVLSHTFQRIVKKAGLENVRFHDLRHTFASLMLSQHAAPKVISEILGHASVAFTMDTYSHIIPGMKEEAMALLDEVLPPGVSVKND